MYIYIYDERLKGEEISENWSSLGFSESVVSEYLF